MMRALSLLVILVPTSCAPVQGVLRAGYDHAMDAQHAVVDATMPPRVHPPLPARVQQVEVMAGYAYIVAVDDGVVVVDCGLDPDPRVLLDAIGGRPVRAVLLTHAHADHDAGCAALGAPLYVGRGDVQRLHRRQRGGALFPHAGDRLVGPSPIPDVVVPVDDGAAFTFGGARFTAIALPGHTSGSTAWLVDDALFTGDAIVNLTGQGLQPSPFTVNDDERRAARAFARLRDVPFTVVLDSHFGATGDGRIEVARALRRLRAEEDAFAVPWSRR